jgi:phosphotransferase system IIB component
VTLGIPYFYAKQKAKKIANTVNTQLQVSSKVDFDINELIKALGGVENILDSSATISTLKVNVKDATNLNKDSFKEFKINGFMKNANQIILVFGDNSQTINKLLISSLNKN